MRRATEKEEEVKWIQREKEKTSTYNVEIHDEEQCEFT